MYFAESSDHPWIRMLETTHVDFGKGKRMIVRGGRSNAKSPIVNVNNFNGSCGF
ncbi:MAG: hypothetical protein GXP18_12690 [Gammaproteobacteria bacterium]|nr:hypothetical protein [Gammaproteobacteria bacterium]